MVMVPEVSPAGSPTVSLPVSLTGEAVVWLSEASGVAVASCVVELAISPADEPGKAPVVSTAPSEAVEITVADGSGVGSSAVAVSTAEALSLLLTGGDSVTEATGPLASD